ncbi:MAG: glycosyltransferase family 2 protein [Candidatus Moranbacteria bacterium]|nr:glycosyltransferase family 2 protein [Candidatus Moranbacteria bacterium]
MKVSILIPAYNEEKTIRHTLKSCLAQTRPADEVIVVDDGSTDRTKEIVEEFGRTVRLVSLPVNTGNKSRAQELGLRYVTGDILIATDADTLLEARFIEKILPHFKDKEVAAVAGYVKSLENNWLTASREIDYIVGQNIYKRAQSFIGFIFVIPGCAAAYRTDIVRNSLVFGHDTVTEDLDFTLQIHELGHRIEFETGAISYTQDPPNVSSYIRQIRRWYGGGWENLKKHFRLIYRSPRAAFELSNVFSDCLFFSFLFLALPIMNTKLFFESLLFIFFPLAVLFCIYAAIAARRIDLAFQPVAFLFIRFLNAIIFLEQFVLVMILGKRQHHWMKSDRIAIT